MLPLRLKLEVGCELVKQKDNGNVGLGNRRSWREDTNLY